MNPAWQDLQAKCDELCRQALANDTILDLTSGVIDVREEHDPISTEVLEETAHVA